jgi:hypothetical protein
MKKVIATLFLGFFTLSTFAQIDIGNLLNAGVEDANVLAKPYLKPWGNMLGSSLNAGWYTSAKVHKLLGFDVTITASYTMSPLSDATFDINDYSDQLTTYELKDDNVSIAPTVAGEMAENERPVLTDKLTGLSEFTMPDGSGIDYLPTPMITAGIGLPYGIELKGRFFPTVKFGDNGKVGLWGLGVQKEIKEYIPGVKHVPFLNLSVLAAYTDFSGSVDVDTDLSDNSTMDILSNAFTTRLLVGANFPVISFYVGTGLSTSSTDFNVLGDYDLDGNTTTDVKDPIQIAYSTNNFDMNAGFRLRLGVIGLHADYTVGDYSSVTAGVGVNFR